MLLTITTTHQPATDLGFLLHKNPSRTQTEDLWFGKVHIFYPEATRQRATAAVVLEVDPVGLARGKRRSVPERALEQYVNDRPYVASSFLSVAIARLFGSALGGRSKDRPELAETPIPLEARLAVIPCRGGDGLVRRLFEPLGYEVSTSRHPLDEAFEDWGRSPYYTLHLSHRIKLKELLTHLYVLIPVLDDKKHYFVGGAEVEKLLGKGEGWLRGHPARELIVDRYLEHRRSLAREALAHLIEEEDPLRDEIDEENEQEEAVIEKRIKLNEERLNAVVAALLAAEARTVLDLGCGEGRLLKMLLKENSFRQILGIDVSHRALAMAKRRLRWDQLPPKQLERLSLELGSLTYRDERFAGFDAAAVVEVIEHMDRTRLAAFERVLFEFARPKTVVLTTPNIEYNVHFGALDAGRFRHRDHQFEWTRAEFANWAEGVGERLGYTVRYEPIGSVEPDTGPPTQMAVFNRP